MTNFKKGGFTLIELLVVIAIIGILAGFIAIQMNGAINVANDAKKKVDIDTIRKALIYYKAQNSAGVYPIEPVECNVGAPEGSNPCLNLATALSKLLPVVPSGSTLEYPKYISETGDDFTVSTILSNTYSYNYSPSTGFITTAPSAGVCGLANKEYASGSTTYGSDNFCSVGTASPASPAFPTVSSATSWTCLGVNGGANNSCVASLASPPCAPGVNFTGTSTACAAYAPTYTGTNSYNYIKITGSGAGILSFSTAKQVDVFLVGGGGGSCYGGGGGGYTATYTGINASGNVSVTVGAGGLSVAYPGTGTSGGASIFGSYQAAGGLGGASGGVAGWTLSSGGNGGSGGGGAGNNCGSGGSGGTNGAGGTRGGGGYNAAGGIGQGTTTREFGVADGVVYGGGGGAIYDGSGGAGGGGRSGGSCNAVGVAGTDGLGGGGGGGTGGNGGSGVVIVRWLK